MRTDSFFPLLVCFLVTTMLGCEPDPVEPPLPPIVQDCSHNTTVPTTDTLEYPPPYQGQTDPDYIYYEGYELLDLSFNPHDPNQLVAAVYINRAGVIPQIPRMVVLLYVLISAMVLKL